jgi:hypothetical protein
MLRPMPTFSCVASTPWAPFEVALREFNEKICEIENLKNL